jgi:DNA repair protein RadC
VPEEFLKMYLKTLSSTKRNFVYIQAGISETSVDIRIILQTALRTNFSSIIVCHNHPSGNFIPSQPDKLLTDKINGACRTMNISLLDHIIVAIEGYYSFADDGKIY